MGSGSQNNGFGLKDEYRAVASRLRGGTAGEDEKVSPRNRREKKSLMDLTSGASSCGWE